MRRRKARRHLLDFTRAVWWNQQPLLVGRHTQAIADALTKAADDLLAGLSTFLLIAVPFRHGKSDLVSRAFPAWVLGHCAAINPDIIMSGYGATLVEGFSKDVKRNLSSPAYRALFPGIKVAHGSDSAAEWQVQGSSGRVTAVGLGGAATGKGGHVIIVDDYCKNRAEAVSKAYRDRVWDSFRTDFMTRRAPASIVIVCATPWHTDDLRGRIFKEMAKDPEFPRFKELKFPARDPHTGEFLFTERFPESWYKEQYGTLGKLAAGLLDCDPVLEGNTRFNTTAVKIHNDVREFPETRYVRAWDLASTEKEREKDDPDSTVGLLGTVTRENGVRHLWIKDARHIQAEAPRRDALILNTALAERGIKVKVEDYAGYKDAYTTLKKILLGVVVVEPSHLPKDKGAKLAPLEAVFDAGNVHLLRGEWNALFLRQFQEFPNGLHDDFCDPCGIIWDEFEGGEVARVLNPATYFAR